MHVECRILYITARFRFAAVTRTAKWTALRKIGKFRQILPFSHVFVNFLNISVFLRELPTTRVVLLDIFAGVNCSAGLITLQSICY